jgi:predicted metal-dependent peptidase
MNEQSVTALKRLSTARATLVLDHTFYGALALRLKLVESQRTRTAATDGRSLFYSAAYVATLTDEELVGLVAHEVMHPALQHHTRRAHRDPKKWNEAADHAINPILVDAGLKLPEGALLDRAYAGLSAEQIFDRLTQPAPQNDEGEPKQEQSKETSAQKSDDSQSEGGDDEDTDESENTEDQGGGGESDESQPDDELADVPGAVLDAPDPAEDAADWQVAIAQAAQAAKAMGRLPAGMAGAIAQSEKSIVDWKSVTRRFMQQVAAADYSWRRPNTRYLASGIYLPELRSESMPPIVLVVDTSASTAAYRARFAGEFQAIVDECCPEATHVICVDAAVQRVDVFARGEPITFNTAGEGGTDFRPAFDYVEREQINPACLIYLTDGEGSFPDSPPDYPTLWAMTTSASAPWGEVVDITEGRS